MSANFIELDGKRYDAITGAYLGKSHVIPKHITDHIEDEATVKRYYPEGERIRFQPANATMQPIYVSKADFRSTMILGQVVGVYHKLPGGKN